MNFIIVVIPMPDFIENMGSYIIIIDFNLRNFTVNY